MVNSHILSFHAMAQSGQLQENSSQNIWSKTYLRSISNILGYSADIWQRQIDCHQPSRRPFYKWGLTYSAVLNAA